MIRHIDGNKNIEYTIDNEDFIVLYDFQDNAVSYTIIDAISFKAMAAYIQSFSIANDSTSLNILYSMYFAPSKENMHSRIGYKVLGTNREKFDCDKLVLYIFEETSFNITTINITRHKNFILHVVTQDGSIILNINALELYMDIGTVFRYEFKTSNNCISNNLRDEMNKLKLKYSLMGKNIGLAYIDGYYCFDTYNKRICNKILYNSKIERDIHDKNIRAILGSQINGTETNRIKVYLDKLTYTRTMRLNFTDFKCGNAWCINVSGRNSFLEFNSIHNLEIENAYNMVIILNNNLSNLVIREASEIVIILDKLVNSSQLINILRYMKLSNSIDINFVLTPSYEDISNVFVTINNYLDLKEIFHSSCSVYVEDKEKFELGHGEYFNIHPMDDLYKKLIKEGHIELLNMTKEKLE